MSTATLTPVLGRQHRLALRALLALHGDTRWLLSHKVADHLSAGRDETASVLTDLHVRGLADREHGRYDDLFRLTARGAALAAQVTPSGVIDGSRVYSDLPRFGADENDLDEEVQS